MNLVLVPLLTACIVFSSGCSAIGTRVAGGRYFSGIRADAAMITKPENFDPSERIHPALAAIDLPFSLVGDILFLPYDSYNHCQHE